MHSTAEGGTRTTTWKKSSEAAKLSLKTATRLGLKPVPAAAVKLPST